MYFSILFLNKFTPGVLFEIFITLREWEYFVMSSLHCSLLIIELCPLVMFASLTLKFFIFVYVFKTMHNFENLYLISPILLVNTALAYLHIIVA